MRKENVEKPDSEQVENFMFMANTLLEHGRMAAHIASIMYGMKGDARMARRLALIANAAEKVEVRMRVLCNTTFRGGK